MKRKVFKMIFFMMFLLVLNGCSAVMAASGTRESAVASLQRGDNKSMVLAKIGHKPLRVATNGSKYIEIYEIEKGNEPSVGRAIAHGTLDLFTFGLWEVVGTPLEAVAGEKSYLIVEYKDDLLESYQITDSVPASL
ncbi:MAG: hypothetical protein KGV57_01275 [Fusobacterium sp.]|nr:hypothetical protein [Fusobacterium sp.]